MNITIIYKNVKLNVNVLHLYFNL